MKPIKNSLTLLLLVVFIKTALFLPLFSKNIEQEQIILKNIKNSNIIENNKLTLTKKEKQYLKSKQIINVCIDPNWFPFEGFDKKGRYIGISSEYFKIFEKKLNISIKALKTNSWSETLEFAKNRKCDVLTLGNATPKRNKYLKFTQAYLKVPFVMTTKNDVVFVSNFKYLKNKKIGVVKDSALEEIIKEKYPNFNIVEVKNSFEGIQKVQNNQLFGYVGNMLSIGYILKNNFITELKIINKLANERSNLAIGVRNDDEILYEIFRKLVLNIDEESKARILDKYINIKYEQEVNYRLLFQVIAIFLFLVLVGILILFILKNKNKKLKKIQKEVNLLNKSLEDRIKEEIEKNKEQQAIVFQQRRLVQMGEMINMIAHQWRQPLSILSLGNQSMQIKYERGKLTEEFITSTISCSEEQIKQMSKTIDDFRNFFKPEKEKSNFYINDILETSISLVKPLLDYYNVKLSIKNSNKIQFFGYENELGQAIINILNNSKDAFIDRKIENKKIDIYLYEEKNIIHLTIKDNAGGIPKDIIDDIFNPYFSTKGEKNGTGIGLYMTKMIICNHLKGDIIVKNEQNGVVFDFVFSQDDKNLKAK